MIVKESTGEWDGALLSSVMRVGSVCMRVMDIICTVSSFGVHSPTTHRPHLRLDAVVIISYNSWPHLAFLQGKVNSARYIAQVVNPVLLPFLRQECDVFFQQDNTRPYMAAVMQHALCCVQQLP